MARKTQPCTHCGLPVSIGGEEGQAGEEREDDAPVFCCPGCESVYHAIRGAGLETFYELQDPAARGREEARADAARQTDEQRLAEFDTGAFLERHTDRLDDGRRSARFHLDGVHCAGCVWIVEQMPDYLDGVDEARLNLGRARLEVTWRPDDLELSSIARWLQNFGYTPQPSRADESSTSGAERDLLRRMGVSWALAGNVMLLTVALYAGMDASAKAGLFHAFRGFSLLLATGSVAYGGVLFFRRAWASIRPILNDPAAFDPTRLSIDIPISLGILGGYLQSAWATVTGTGEVWFDSVTVLIAALLTARWLQIRGRRMAGDAADRLLSVIPTTARHVAPSGRTVPVPTEALEAGSVIEVRPDEVIPADGHVVEGESAVHRGVLTGESRPERVEVGDRVHAGAKNTGDVIRVEISAAGEDSRIGRLLEWIDEHGGERAPVVELADRLAGAFVLTVLGAAAATWAGWTWAGSPEAIRHAVALLVVSCPCALGMATPLALTMGVGRAARRGIFIKHEGVLQHLEHLDELILDKTGTVTAGEMHLVGFDGDREAVEMAARLEARGTHPVAEGFRKWLGNQAETAGLRNGDSPRVLPTGGEDLDGVALDETPAKSPPFKKGESLGSTSSPSGPADVEEVPGCGIVGTIDGHRLAVGRPEWIAEEYAATPWPDGLAEAVDRAAAHAHTPVAVTVDGEMRAVCALGDPIRAQSAELVEQLRAMDVEVTLLSGDHPEVVHSVADTIGIPAERAFGDVSPEDKKAFVESRLTDGSDANKKQDRRRVAMVGDGVNDAAALTAATVGIAVDGSADASLVAADVFTTRGGLGPLTDLIDGSGSVMGVVRRNIGMSVAYNAAGISAAAAGLVSPLVAAVAMPISSVAVVISSILQNSFEASSPEVAPWKSSTSSSRWPSSSSPEPSPRSSGRSTPDNSTTPKARPSAS